MVHDPTLWTNRPSLTNANCHCARPLACGLMPATAGINPRPRFGSRTSIRSRNGGYAEPWSIVYVLPTACDSRSTRPLISGGFRSSPQVGECWQIRGGGSPLINNTSACSPSLFPLQPPLASLPFFPWPGALPCCCSDVEKARNTASGAPEHTDAPLRPTSCWICFLASPRLQGHFLSLTVSANPLAHTLGTRERHPANRTSQEVLQQASWRSMMTRPRPASRGRV